MSINQNPSRGADPIRYAVLLHAQNLRLLNHEARPVPGGAYTWRIVEATGPAEAGDRAADRLQSEELFLQEIWNPPEEPPKIVVEEVNELRSDGATDSGYIYYFDREEDYPFGAEEDPGDEGE